MKCLIYKSTALAAIDSADCRSIVDISVRNNARNGLTGFLHAEPGLFVQYIEGPSRALERLFRRIGTDHRHENIVLLGEGPIPGRRFPSWSMGYSSSDILSLPDFLSEVTGQKPPFMPSGAEALYFLMAASQRVDLGISSIS